MDADRTPVVFTVEELWLLQDAIRHETPNQEEEWIRPPSDLDFNNEIALALVVCYRHQLPEYTLMLSMGDCLAIDYTVAQDAKTPEGADGRVVLFKSFEARRRLLGLDDENEAVGNDYSFEQVSNLDLSEVEDANTVTDKKDDKDVSRRPNKTRATKDSGPPPG